MSDAWILVCLVVIGALYALLFTTADSLDADERQHGKSGHDAVPAPYSETTGPE